jgi:adenylate cyclase
MRIFWMFRPRRLTIEWLDGTRIVVRSGKSLLQMILCSGRAHASTCGGRGQCSTCRVRVISGADRLRSPAGIERQRLLEADLAPDIRLACQVLPRFDLTIEPLVSPRHNAQSPPTTT